VRTAPIDNDSIANLAPMVSRFVDKGSHLMTDQLQAYTNIGLYYASHQSVNHGNKEYARGDVHNSTAESFNAIVERAKQGVFHFWSKEHLNRYLHEFGFRWNHREPKIKKTRKGKLKLVMKPLPVMVMIRSLISAASGKQIRRSPNGGITCLTTN
jgi:hypothetical protein